MIKNCGRILCSIAVPAMVCGCATVNPRPDYDRVAKHVAQATGQRSIYQPGDDDLVDRKVAELLADGVSAEEAVQICLLNNRSLQAEFQNVGMARADVVQSGLLSNPSFGLSLRLPAGGGLANLEAGIAQNIADLWQIPVRKRVAQRELERAILELAGAAADLAADAKVAYFDAVAIQQLHETALENLKIASELLELAGRRQAAGAGTEVDVNLSRGAVVDAELEVVSSRLAMAESRRALAKLLALTGSADELVLLDPLPPAPARLPDLGRVLELSKRWRLDMRAAWQAVGAAEAALQEQYRLIIPFVELGVEMERGERGRSEGRDLLADTARASIANGALTAPDIQPRSERRRNTDLIIGPTLGLELPIFDQNQAQIAKAKYACEQARKTLDALDRVVAQEVRGALDRAATAWELAQLYRDRSIPLAERNLELSRKAYQAGKVSFLEVLEAQQFFLQSRSKYIEALQTAAGTIPELERTVGRPFQELVEAAADEAPIDTE
jgi:cobalt-zinc-cadmium efflux system outer membrane protein